MSQPREDYAAKYAGANLTIYVMVPRLHNCLDCYEGLNTHILWSKCSYFLCSSSRSRNRDSPFRTAASGCYKSCRSHITSYCDKIVVIPATESTESAFLFYKHLQSTWMVNSIDAGYVKRTCSIWIKCIAYLHIFNLSREFRKWNKE